MKIKKITLLIMLCLNISWAFSQHVDINVGDIFEFNRTLDDRIVQNIYSISDATLPTIERDRRIKITNYNTEANTVSFVYLDDPTQIFDVSMDVMKLNAKKQFRRYKGAQAAVYSVPFRLRGIGSDSLFDFQSTLNLEGNLIFGFGPSHWERSLIDFSVGIGITSVDLTEQNTITELNNDRTATAFTISSGFVINITKTANIGAFIGWDMLALRDRGIAEKELNWIFNGKMWVGIGLNVSLSELSTNELPANQSESKPRFIGIL